MKNAIVLLLSFVFINGIASPGHAQAPTEASTESPAQKPDEDGETSLIITSDETVDYFYEKPTMQKLSQMYWGISHNDINRDEHIDNFMMINECDIYKDYFHNEFEWRDVREASRAFIQANRKTFPLRFEFVQPLKLGEYDISKKRFDILPDYKILGIRRFEMLPPGYRDEICGNSWNIEGYPRGLVIELSRPFMLSYLTVEPELAEEFIKEKLKIFNSLKSYAQTQSNLFDTRDAFLIMKVKFFASKGETKMQEGIALANVLGVLEGFDVYATRNKEGLIFSKSFRKRSKDRKTDKPASTTEQDDGHQDLEEDQSTPAAEAASPATQAAPAVP